MEQVQSSDVKIYQIPQNKYLKKKKQKRIQKSPQRCRGRTWTQQQDERLTKLVNKYGQKWSYIGKVMGDKKGKSCRQRWINNLDPKINWNRMNIYQQWLLFLGVRILGSQWAQISSLFSNRTDNQLKNHCHTSSMFKKTDTFKHALREIIKRNDLKQIADKVISNSINDQK